MARTIRKTAFVRLEPELHKALRLRALEQGTTLQSWIYEACKARLAAEERAGQEVQHG